MNNIRTLIIVLYFNPTWNYLEDDLCDNLPAKHYEEVEDIKEMLGRVLPNTTMNYIGDALNG
jgi:hypothetical protein